MLPAGKTKKPGEYDHARGCPIGDAVWIVAPTSGILHVAGEGYPRRDCQAGTLLLCGWVLTAQKVAGTVVAKATGRRCATCSRWILSAACARAGACAKRNLEELARAR